MSLYKRLHLYIFDTNLEKGCFWKLIKKNFYEFKKDITDDKKIVLRLNSNKHTEDKMIFQSNKDIIFYIDAFSLHSFRLIQTTMKK